MTNHIDLIQQAAAGCASAQLGLADAAITAGAEGFVRQLESLVAAETWTRLAASIGGAEEQRALVGVLLARADFELQRGGVGMSAWYENEARRVLNLLVALDDPDAASALAELGPADADHEGPNIQYAVQLAAAAQGDVDALCLLRDHTYALIDAGRYDPIEALTAGELYARLASSSGETAHMRSLAGFMFKRAEFELRAGYPILADNAFAEAAVILSILIDHGDESIAPWLTLLVDEAPRSAIAKAAHFRPTILKFIEPEGSC